MISEAIRRHRLPAGFEQTVDEVFRPLANQVAAWRSEQAETLVLGLNGAQGCGKSTMADFLSILLRQEHGLSSAVLSIDDLYLTKAEREALASEVHPMFRTRGVPGTHDDGSRGLGRFRGGILCAADPVSVTSIPRFDKGTDDRHATDAWGSFTGRPDVIIFEGWCVDARAEESVAEPINELERSRG